MPPDSDSPIGPCPPAGEGVPRTTDYVPEVAPERVIAGGERAGLAHHPGESGTGYRRRTSDDEWPGMISGIHETGPGHPAPIGEDTGALDAH